MDIDFITFIGPNSADYAEYLKYTCETFVSGKHNIHWKAVESVGVDRMPKGYQYLFKAPNMEHNSLNHGTAMNMALDYIESDYVVFIDADMAIVHKNWDDIIVNELNDYDCFGVSYAHGKKYKDFPTVYLFAFRSYVLDKSALDFRPSVKRGVDSPVRKKLNKQEAKIFGMKPGSILKCDTGWRLPLVKIDGITSKSMPMVMMTSEKAQLPFESYKHKKICMRKPGHMYEWHYNGKVFTTHKQASRVHPLKETWGDAWKRRIDLYIKENINGS